MKLKNIVVAAVIALSTQIVGAEECKTTKFIGKTSGSAAGAAVGSTLGVAAVGATTTCAASLAAAPFTFGLSALLGCAGAFGAARIAGRVIGETVGETSGRQIAKIICDSHRKVPFKVDEIVLVNDLKGVIVDINNKRKRVRLIVSNFGHLLPVELDISQIAKLK